MLRKAVGLTLGEVLGVLDRFALGSVLGTRDSKSKEQDFNCEKSYDYAKRIDCHCERCAASWKGLVLGK